METWLLESYAREILDVINILSLNVLLLRVLNTVSVSLYARHRMLTE
jgi:hypothetical protein